MSHITFAHEVGHNFGSPHDETMSCKPGEQGDKSGNYLMFPSKVLKSFQVKVFLHFYILKHSKERHRVV